jgi:hypothetical protein
MLNTHPLKVRKLGLASCNPYEFVRLCLKYLKPKQGIQSLLHLEYLKETLY